MKILTRNLDPLPLVYMYVIIANAITDPALNQEIIQQTKNYNYVKVVWAV